MEEIDELRAKVIASMSSSANPNSLVKGKSPESREEGELSGEDADLPTCATTPFDSTALNEPIPATTSTDNLALSLKAINNIPTISSRMVNMQFRTSVPRTYGKHFKTKQVPVKSSNNQTLRWHGKGLDDNLVISFSDGDSGSDSEESKQEKNVNKKGNTVGLDKSRKPIAPARTQPDVLRGLATSRTKLMPKKRFVSHAPISSTTEVRGGRPVASSVGKGSLIQRYSSVIKSLANQENEHVRDANLADHEVESLRHQIAVRENELKVQSESIPQSKERATVSRSDQRRHHVKNPDTEAAGISVPASAPTMESAPDARAIKRLKLDEHSKSNLYSSGQLQTQMPSTRSMGCHESEKGNFIDRTDPRPDRRHQEASRDDPMSFKSLLNEVKNNESLLPTTSSTLPELNVPYKHASIDAADLSCSHHQSGKKATPVDSPTILNRSLSQMEHNVVDGALRQSDMSIRRNTSSESPRHSNISRRADVPNPLQNKATCKCNLLSSQQIVAKTGVRLRSETSNHIFEKYSVSVPDLKLGNDEVNISGVGSMQLESLMKLEELEDKELEEAQEHRRRCELEERLALKAYRKAQRALVDANERCTLSYRKREFLSAQLRALIMEASSAMWPFRSALDSVKNVPNASFDLLSSLGHQLPAEGHIVNRSGYDCSNQCSDGPPLDTHSQRIFGHYIGSDQCLEPVASTSEPKDNSAMNGIYALVNHSSISSDEDDVNFPTLASDVMRGSHGEKVTDMNGEIERLPSSEIAQDYELLEATLRSKLVARLGTRTSSKINEVSNAECTADKGADSTGENKKPSASLEQRLQEGEKNLRPDLEGIELSGRNNNQLIERFNYQSHGNILSLCDESYRNIDPEVNNSFHKEFCRPSNTTVFSLPSPVVRIVSRHAKLIMSGCFDELPTAVENRYTLRNSAKIVFKNLPDVVGDSTKGYNFRSARTGERVSHMYDLAIDPFLPFCMFELRGKCNNEECSWQHFNNCAKGNLKHTDHPATSNSDGRINNLLTCGKSNDPIASGGLCHQILSVPAYQIGSNIIKVDSHFFRSVLARSTWQYWQRGFCASFPSPFSVQRILTLDTPFLQSSDGAAAVDYRRNMLSLYSKSQDGTMKQSLQVSPDSEHSLEMALDLFDGKVYKPDEKALSLLARAIEADTNSVVLWVVYLHIFYGKVKGIGKDDMFFHAVKHNEGSYELWLMYINSRVQVGERLNAYDDALAVFCQRKDFCEKERKYTSACILDIFLQMVDFLCMSGDADKAIWRIYGLLPTADFENSGDTSLSDVHSCLVVSDKCIFWFCCTYLVIYGKLPEPIVRRFEFEKDLLFEFEWPSAPLTVDRKDRALELMSVAMDNVLNFHRRDQSALRSIHFLAVSHVRCVAALEGLHCSADLLAKYTKSYPACIELVLIASRLQNNYTDNVQGGFEGALCDWPKENPGLQCLWNQYAEHALEIRGFNFTQKLMSRWFKCFWRGKDSCSENLDGRGNGSCSSSELPSHVKSDSGSHSPLEDDTFGLLNLSLYQLLQKNLADARVAIDKALKLAAPEDYPHCAREHAAFIFTNESVSDNISSRLVCGLLKSYLEDSRSSPMLEPLSRRYFLSIKKPRIRQLITNILGPVSMDFSLVNSVLEACYGPSLLPEKFGEPNDLVDLVESLAELAPANYELALSVYRLTSRNFSGTGITSNGIRFWASSLLVNSVFQAVPAAPELVWLEAANVLRDLENLDISLRFHQQAISVYPFSIKLWQSYFDLSRVTGNSNAVVGAARERGVELGHISF